MRERTILPIVMANARLAADGTPSPVRPLNRSADVLVVGAGVVGASVVGAGIVLAGALPPQPTFNDRIEINNNARLSFIVTSKCSC